MQQYKDIGVNAYRLLDPRDTYPAYPGNHSNNVNHKVLAFKVSRAQLKIIVEVQILFFLPFSGINVSMTKSVVKLAPRCFCDPNSYLRNNTPKHGNIHSYINTFVPTYDLNCPRGTFRKDVR